MSNAGSADTLARTLDSTIARTLASSLQSATVLRIDPAGNTVVWDTIPGEDCFSLVIRDNGDVYVSCVSGNVYRYLGGDPGQRVPFGTWGSSNTGLVFSPDFKFLFHTSYAEGKLRIIDPDTASDTVVVDADWGSIGIAVAGSQFAPGSFARIGNGIAGAGGLMPTLEGVGSPTIDSSVVLETRDFVGGALNFFMVSAGRNDIDGFGGTIYPSFLDPFAIWAGTLPGASGSPGKGTRTATSPFRTTPSWSAPTGTSSSSPSIRRRSSGSPRPRDSGCSWACESSARTREAAPAPGPVGSSPIGPRRVPGRGRSAGSRPAGNRRGQLSGRTRGARSPEVCPVSGSSPRGAGEDLAQGPRTAGSRNRPGPGPGIPRGGSPRSAPSRVGYAYGKPLSRHAFCFYDRACPTPSTVSSGRSPMKVLAPLSLLFATFLAAPAAAQFVDGHVFVTDWTTSQVYEADPNGWGWTVFADTNDGISGPSAVGFTSAGTMLVANYHTSTVIEFDHLGNGTVVLDANDGLAGPWGENGIAIDAAENIYIANYNASQILRFDKNYQNGIVFADAADGIVQPDGLGFHANGDLYVANRSSGGQVLKIDPAGNTVIWDTIPNEDCFSLVFRDNGDIYVSCISGNVFHYPGGDVNQRYLFGTWGSSNTGLRFSPDFKVLFHTSYGEGKLRIIDPDTASDTVVIDAGWGSIGIAVAGSQFAPGSWAKIGNGVAGAGGLIPTLEGVGDPVIGNTVVIETRDFVGGAMSYFLVSTGRNDIDGFGGTIYPSFMDPFYVTVGILPGTFGTPGDGDEDRKFGIPNNKILVGTNWYFQQFALDPAALFGVSMTNGLRMFVGL